MMCVISNVINMDQVMQAMLILLIVYMRLEFRFDFIGIVVPFMMISGLLIRFD